MAFGRRPVRTDRFPSNFQLHSAFAGRRNVYHLIDKDGLYHKASRIVKSLLELSFLTLLLGIPLEFVVQDCIGRLCCLLLFSAVLRSAILINHSRVQCADVDR